MRNSSDNPLSGGIGGILFGCTLLCAIVSCSGCKKSPVRASVTVFDCVSTAGATKGMTTVLKCYADGSAEMIGLDRGLWYRSNLLDEPKDSDLTLQGFVNGTSYIDTFHLYMDGNQILMKSHDLNMSCRSR